MKTETFRGRDFITLLEWSKEEVETILDVALDLKRRYAVGELHDHILRAKTLFMVFYNQSLRTRNSFEAGMTQLGGHAHFLDPSKIYTIALTNNRDNYEGQRWTKVSIEGAESYTNASSAGILVNSEDSVSLSAYNTENGYVAKWVQVAPGSDGSFSIVSQWDDSLDGSKAYAMSAFMLKELAP